MELKQNFKFIDIIYSIKEFNCNTNRKELFTGYKPTNIYIPFDDVTT